MGTGEKLVLGALGVAVAVLLVVGLAELRHLYRRWRSGHWDSHLARISSEVTPERWGTTVLTEAPTSAPPRQTHWPVRNSGDSSYEGEQL